MAFSDIYTNLRNTIRQNVPYGVRAAGKALAGGYTPELGGGLIGAADNAFLNPSSQGPNASQSLYNAVTSAFPASNQQGTVLGAYDVKQPYGPDKPSIDLSQPLTATVPGSGGSAAGAAFQPIVYKGTQYTDLGSYQNAIHKDAVDQYNQQKKYIDQAYQNGLISFNQAQQQLDFSRQNIQTQHQQNLDQINAAREASLSALSQFFSNASPEAYQSQQGAKQQQAVDLSNQGLQNENTNFSQNTANLDNSQTNLGISKQQAEQQYQNNVQQLNDALVSQQDQLANQALDFRAKQAAAYSAAAPKVTQYDPTEIIKGLAGLYQQDTQNYGLTDQQARLNLKQTLQQTGLNANDQAAIEQYFYGNYLPQLTR